MCPQGLGLEFFTSALCPVPGGRQAETWAGYSQAFSHPVKQTLDHGWY